MANLTRTIQIIFRVTTPELQAIADRMNLCGVKSRARYMRAMAINGCIIKPDHSDIKHVNEELNKIGTNINLVAKRVNETGIINPDDIKSLQEMLDRTWLLQRHLLDDKMPKGGR